MAKIEKLHESGCAGGTCSCPWRLDFRPQGMSGARKRVLFPTKKAAEAHLHTTAHKVSRCEYVAPEAIPTFGQVAQQWLADKAGSHPATLSCARTVLRHLGPLDPIRMDLITVATIEKLRDALRAEGLGHKTVGDIMTAIRAVFKVAMKHNSAITNPAALASRPRKPVEEVRDAREVETRALPPTHASPT